MPTYPASETERRVDAVALGQLVGAVFRRSGMRPNDAALLADTLVTADRRGVHSHGVLRVPEYVRKLAGGGVDPQGRPEAVRQVGACLVVDGGNSMGQIGAHFAMRRAIEVAGGSVGTPGGAPGTGIAAAAVRGSNHCGAMAYYAMQALPADMIGLATTNALPTMAPWGGAERLLGINPLAVAVPAGEELPIVYDAAFSATAHGKVRVYRQKGLELPPGWALDRDGNPTTDAAAALDGLLLPIGGFKGTALALLMGLLSSMLSGAAYGTELGSMEDGPRPGQDGHFLLAISIAAFEDVARFKARVDGAVRQLRGARKAPDTERIYAPGELEFETAARYDREGVPLNQETLGDLAATARACGVDPAPLTDA
jgi:LDH2 family malate/lactate/ureidoglycolate dehydrogenase